MKKVIFEKYLQLAVAVVWFAITLPSYAQSIDWGNTVLDDNYQSDGTTLLSGGSLLSGSGFTFELGVFSGGFTPGGGNVSLWGTNWVSLDSDTYNGSGFFNEFGDTGITNGDTSIIGKQVYIWGYDSLVSVTSETPGAQTILLTNDAWILLDTAQAGTPQQYFTSAANTAVFGAATVDPDGVGPDNPFIVQGVGEYTLTADPSSSAVGWELQTGTFPIPEPSSTILVLLAFTLAIFSRRRPLR